MVRSSTLWVYLQQVSSMVDTGDDRNCGYCLLPCVPPNRKKSVYTTRGVRPGAMPNQSKAGVSSTESSPPLQWRPDRREVQTRGTRRETPPRHFIGDGAESCISALSLHEFHPRGWPRLPPAPGAERRHPPASGPCDPAQHRAGAWKVTSRSAGSKAIPIGRIPAHRVAARVGLGGIKRRPVHSALAGLQARGSELHHPAQSSCCGPSSLGCPYGMMPGRAMQRFAGGPRASRCASRRRSYRSAAAAVQTQQLSAW